MNSQVVFPQKSPVCVLPIMVCLVPFHYSWWLEVDSVLIIL